jgi:hypothetical protein
MTPHGRVYMIQLTAKTDEKNVYVFIMIELLLPCSAFLQNLGKK